jgi:hypothetical protein
MTQTIQPCSLVLINNADKDITKSETVNFQFEGFKLEDFQSEDNTRLLLSLFDSMNNLYEKLSRLNYVLKRKLIEASVSQKTSGEKK